MGTLNPHPSLMEMTCIYPISHAKNHIYLFKDTYDNITKDPNPLHKRGQIPSPLRGRGVWGKASAGRELFRDRMSPPNRMKLLYEIASGHVLARYADILDAQLAALSFSEPAEPAADSGRALITVPDSVAIPQAVIRVIHSASNDQPEFIVDQDAVAQQWRNVKEGRNQQLAASDWICSVSDFAHPKKEEFVVYRQALRDITQQANPFALVWPSAPQ